MSLKMFSLLPINQSEMIAAPAVNTPLTVEFKTAIPQEWEIRRGKLRHVSLDESGGLIPTETVLNAWEVRGEFLTVSSGDEMLQFLGRTGTFSHARESGYWSIDDLFAVQRVIRYLMSTHPSKWRSTPKVFRGVFGDDKGY